MKIVIDIPEEHYEYIQNLPHYKRNYAQDLILDGTPLPKGHGRLIDADELKEIWHGCKFVGSIDCLVDCRPTIIGAESEEEE